MSADKDLHFGKLLDDGLHKVVEHFPDKFKVFARGCESGASEFEEGLDRGRQSILAFMVVSGRRDGEIREQQTLANLCPTGSVP